MFSSHSAGGRKNRPNTTEGTPFKPIPFPGIPLANSFHDFYTGLGGLAATPAGLFPPPLGRVPSISSGNDPLDLSSKELGTGAFPAPSSEPPALLPEILSTALPAYCFLAFSAA